MIRLDSISTRTVSTGFLLLVAMLGACTRPAPTDRETRLASMDPEARRIYAQLEQDHLLRRDGQVLELGDRLLAAPYADRLPVDVATMMVASALRLSDLDRARDVAMAVPLHFSAEARLEEPMFRAADGLAAAGRGADAVRILARLVGALTEPARRGGALQKGAPLVQSLTDAELRDMLALYGGTRLADLLQREADQRMAGPVVEAARPAELGHLGVLVPLTGRYARFGNAFLSGVLLAAQDVPPVTDQPWSILHEDTEGDIVGAALAARRLIEEKDCGVLIGALLSTTTATAALAADHLGIPLISPTATHERLDQLGENVLQTNRTGPAEVQVLARLMCEVLLKERFAVIRSDSYEGLVLAEAFAQTVARYGGRVIHEEIFEPSATNFRPQIERLRAERPEVVLVHASVDQMILLGPQLDFYRLGALVLGTSEWNSSRLLQRAGTVMERAIFPVSEMHFPPVWSADFKRAWPYEEHDEESTRIARSAYLAMRLVLQSLAGGNGNDTDRLIAKLHAGLAGQDVDLRNAEAFSAIVRLVENEQIVAFPIHRYDEALRRMAHEDSTSVDLGDEQVLVD